MEEAMTQDNKKPLHTLYETLKSDNYDVPDTYESFELTLTAPGKEGTNNRLTLYKTLKSDNYDVPDTYESFANTLFAPAKSPEGTGAAKAVSRNQGTAGSAGAMSAGISAGGTDLAEPQGGGRSRSRGGGRVDSTALAAFCAG